MPLNEEVGGRGGHGEGGNTGGVPEPEGYRNGTVPGCTVRPGVIKLYTHFGGMSNNRNVW